MIGPKCKILTSRETGEFRSTGGTSEPMIASGLLAGNQGCFMLCNFLVHYTYKFSCVQYHRPRLKMMFEMLKIYC